MSAVHVLHFHVQQFHVLQFRPFVSRPAFPVIPVGLPEDVCCGPAQSSVHVLFFFKLTYLCVFKPTLTTNVVAAGVCPGVGQLMQCTHCDASSKYRCYAAATIHNCPDDQVLSTLTYWQ